MSDLVMIQANSTGYSGKACTVLSVYDPGTGLLKIKKLAKFQTARAKGCLVVGFDSAGDVDLVMLPEHFREGVQAFLDFYGTDKGDGRMLRLESGTERASPSSVIEVGEYDESGPKVRIDSGVTCEQMGVVATCWAARSQSAVKDCFAMFDTLGAFQCGMGFSI